MLPRLSLPNANDLLRQIMDQFFREPDQRHHRRGRDTRDPETRWRLEELGGAIAAEIAPSPPSLNPGMKKSRRRSHAVA